MILIKSKKNIKKKKEDGNEAKVNEIYEILKKEYGIDGFMYENEAKEKIRELNCDIDACIAWVVEYLENSN